jgi:hypothetical protein
MVTGSNFMQWNAGRARGVFGVGNEMDSLKTIVTPAPGRIKALESALFQARGGES